MLQNKKNILITTVWVVVVFAAIIAGAIYAVPGSEWAAQQQTIHQVKLPDDGPIQTRVVSSLRVRKDIKQFAKVVDAIVIGAVKSVDGPRQDKAKGMIFSHIVVEVEQYLKNPQAGKQIKIKRLGGQFGNEEVIVENEPEFKSGERVLLFLGTDFKKDFVVYAGDYGKFSIDNDIAIGSENETILLTDLITQIRANIK